MRSQVSQPPLQRRLCKSFQSCAISPTCAYRSLNPLNVFNHLRKAYERADNCFRTDRS